MVHVNYVIEAGVSAALLLPLWVLYLSQLATHRCTPLTSRHPVHARAVLLGFGALLLDSVAVLDFSAVFGILNMTATKALEDLACVCEVAFLCSCAQAGMASLLRQVGRSLDKKISGLMEGLVCIYLASSIAIPIAETALLARPQSRNNEDGLLVCQLLRNYIFVALVAGFIILLWIVYARLRSFVGGFIRSLERAMRVEGGNMQKMQQQEQQQQQQQQQQPSPPPPQGQMQSHTTTQKSAEQLVGDTPATPIDPQPQRRPNAAAAVADWGDAAAATVEPQFVLEQPPHHKPQPSNSHLSQLAVAAATGATVMATPRTPLPPPSATSPPPKGISGSLSSRNEFARGPSSAIPNRVTAARCETLRLAMWRHTRLTFLISIVALFGISVTLSGDVWVTTYASPDPNIYHSGRAVSMAIQLVSLALIWWVAKVPLQPLQEALSKGRLWYTFCHGPGHSHAAVEPLPFAAAHARVPAAAVSSHGEQPQQQPQAHPPHVTPGMHLTIKIVGPTDNTPTGAAMGTPRGTPRTPGVVVAVAAPSGAGMQAHPAAAGSVGAASALLRLNDTLLQPLDSAASKPHSGLSMRSGRTSFRAVRRDGDAGLAEDEEEEGGLTDGVTHAAAFSGALEEEEEEAAVFEQDDAAEDEHAAAAAAAEDGAIPGGRRPSLPLSLPLQHATMETAAAANVATVAATPVATAAREEQ